MILEWLVKNLGTQKLYTPDVKQCKAVLERFANLHSAYFDLGVAYLDEEKFDKAEFYINKALELNFPVPSMAYNCLGYIESQKGNLSKTEEYFQRALECHPADTIIKTNVENLRQWLDAGGFESGKYLGLEIHDKFKMHMGGIQPAYPGPLPELTEK